MLELEVPRPLDDELALDASREGMPKQEHALLLVCIANALLGEGEPTPFKEAVRVFLSHRALDTDSLTSALDELVALCATAPHDAGKLQSAFQRHFASDTDDRARLALAAWRNVVVHHSGTLSAADVSSDLMVSPIAALDDPAQTSGRLQRTQAENPAPIVLDEQGVPWIQGTTTKVIEVVLNKAWSGQSPEDVQRDMPHLSLAQVYSALSYYHAHREELEADIARRERLVAELTASAGPSPVGKRFRALGKLL